MTQAKRLYETFCAATTVPMHRLPWEELPPIIQNGWEAVWEAAEATAHGRENK